MFRRIAVGDIMTRNFAHVKPSTSLNLCSKEMVKKRLNSLILMEKGKLKGILTARDILWVLTKKSNLDLRKFNAIDVATKKVAVIKSSANIGQALHKMKKYGFRRLPVLSRGEVVGMLTIKDIMRIDPTVYREIDQMKDVREENRKLERLATREEYDVQSFCEECDSFSTLLRMEGRLLCTNCRNDLF